MKNNNKGFSLVELIVVIAIMAILAAVAVVGVSVYIPKAQQANDKQMIADIQYAISLYTSAETLTPGESGFVVVHKNGGVSVGGSLDAAPDQLITNALKATFGENYANELKVTYPKWTGTLAGDDLTSISGSTYIDNTDDLLEKVQTLTNKVKDVFGGGSDAQAQANQTTLGVADYLTNQYSETDAFYDWWTNPSGGFNIDMGDVATTYACGYARVESMVLYANSFAGECTVTDENGAVVNVATLFNSLSNGMSGASDLDVIYNTMMDHFNECDRCYCAILSDWETETIEWNSYFNKTENPPALTDAKAFLALMKQVDQSADDIVNNVGLDSKDFYSSDYVKDVINGYATTADVMGNGNAVDGDIVIVVTVDSKGALSYKVYPVEY